METMSYRDGFVLAHLVAPRGLRLINDRDGHAAVLALFDTALNE
jgi:hypothetical protein